MTRVAVEDAIPGPQQPVLVWLAGHDEPVLATIAPRRPWLGEPAPIAWLLPQDVPAGAGHVTHWRYLSARDSCSGNC